MNLAWADPILTCVDAKALEARLFGGDEECERAAMERAGAGVAAAVMEDFREIGGFPEAGRILVLAGKGHNGGDALLAAAAILAAQPAASADVVFVFGERALRPLAARAWQQLMQAAPQRVRSLGRVLPTAGAQSSLRPPASASVIPAVGAQPCLRPPVPAGAREWQPAYDICLDGIFGFQFHPPMDAAIEDLLREVNRHPAIRLRAAVDLPSGVGEAPGGAAFRADFTYATGSVKAPLLEERNRDAAGRLRYCDLGFFAGDATPPSRAPLGNATGASRLQNTACTPAHPKQGTSGPAGVADSGLPAIASAKAGPDSPTPAADFVLKPSVLAPLAALRAPGSDKRAFGHLFVVGGSRSYPGAALMCVRAALRSGVGLVTAFVPESLAPAFAAAAPEAIWVGWPETPQGGLALEGLHLLREQMARATALVMGCGLGRESETQLLAGEIVALAGVPVVLDADALQPPVLASARGKRVICLPHAGEFKRLAGGRGGMGILPMSRAPEATGEDRPSPGATAGRLTVPHESSAALRRPSADAPELSPNALRDLARETNAVIVLKGPVTRISDGERVFHSFFGGPVLARGGSGDLLAGLVGGLLAQSGVAERRPVPSGNERADASLLAACRGVVWHGMAADLLARDRGQVAVQVTQLLDYLPDALRDAAG